MDDHTGSTKRESLDFVRLAHDRTPPVPLGRTLEALVHPGIPAYVDSLFEASLPPDLDPSVRRVRIGTDFGSDIIVDVSTGEVRSVRGGDHQPDDAVERFVNSKLECFVEFLRRVHQERAQFRHLTDSELDARVERTRQDLELIDAQAFSNPENWWSVVFEQIEAGLL